MSEFHLLNSAVKDLAISRFSVPTLIQKMAIPRVLKGKSILAIAGTGSGKTESLLTPLLSKLKDKEHEPIALLYITPLRSLNRDLLERFIWWCNKLDIDVSVRHGDTTQRERKLQVEHPPTLLITTPEQIGAMLSGKKLRELLKNIKYIVIDEAHELVDNKRGVQLAVALERLKELCGRPQIMALSATIGSPKKAADFIFGGQKHEIINAIEDSRLRIKVESPFPNKSDKILAEKIFVGDNVAARLRRIHDLMTSHKATLLFTNTREAAEVLSSRLGILDSTFAHDIHHSSLSKEMRVDTEKKFKEEQIRGVIATSSLQLGIDIGSIDLVIQYMSPREVTQLTQRIGRSGHGVGRTSKGIILSSDGDDIFESAVVARKAQAGELERIKFHEKAWDVLVHQITGLAMEEYQIPADKAYGIIKRAWPYRNLTAKEFFKIMEFMKQIHLIWTDHGIARKRKAFDYYFSNLSVIPDNISYKVVDMTVNKHVGTLDEAFVAEHSTTGSTFIVKGRPWKVVSVDGDKVYVEPVGGLDSAVPAWQGELIPVPFEVAQEVGALRRQIAGMIARGRKTTEITGKIKRKYPVSSQVASRMISMIKKQMKFHIPDNKSMIFEHYSNFTVVHACFGTQTNETMARYISALLSAEQGRVISSKTDPYRIIFGNVQPEDIKKVLKEVRPEHLEVVLERALPSSSLYKHRFVQVAKRMGIIRKGARYDKINIRKLIDLYKDSVVGKETLRELFTDKLDVQQAKETIRRIQKGKVKFIDSDRLSPLGEHGLRYELHDVATPNRPEKEILQIFRQRIMKTKLRLVCVNCGKYSVTYRVKEIAKDPRCPKCSSKLLAVVPYYATEAQEIVKKRLRGRPMTAEEQKKLQRIKMSADVMICYGKKGAVVLAGRGVGPQTALRILARMHKTDEAMFKAILKAEKKFLETHRFWSN